MPVQRLLTLPRERGGCSVIPPVAEHSRMTGAMPAATISSAASAPSSKLPRVAY